MPAPPELAVVTAMSEELAPLLARAARLVRIPMPEAKAYRGTLGGRPLLLASTGDGALLAERGLSAILSRCRIAGVVGAGLAGALTRGLPAGTILVARSVSAEAGGTAAPDGAWTERVLSAGGALPARFQTAARIAGTREEKARLRDAGGEGAAADEPAAVDLESAAWTRAASPSRTPLILVRVVSDTSEEEIPLFVAEARREDGSVDRGRIVRHALRHPSTVGKLLAMRRRTRFCAERLASYLETLLAREALL